MAEKKYQYNVYQCRNCGRKETKSIGLGLPMGLSKCSKSPSGIHRWIIIAKK